MDAATRKLLVDGHSSLVQAIATKVKRQLSSAVELDDLVAYGTQGLLEAADRFDPARGAAFSTFAYYRVRGAIYDGVRRMANLPRSVYARVKALERVHEYLTNLADRELGARSAGSPPPGLPSQEDDLRAMYQAMRGAAACYVTSLDALADQGLELADDRLSADEVAALKQVTRKVKEVLVELPDKERHFIQKHYFEGKALAEAGAELGLSKSWASRLHARAVDLLRAKLLKPE